MENNALTSFTGGSPSLFGNSGGSLFSAIKYDLLDLLYHGQYIQAKERLAQAMIQATHEQKMAYIRILGEIAASVTDDRTREQMFRDIWMLCAQNQ